MPLLELGEFTSGSCKGFKYWYQKMVLKTPSSNLGDIYFGHITQDELQQIQLLYILNTAIKQRYAEQVASTKIPIQKLGKDNDNVKAAIAESLARLYPDGILNTKEEALNNPPWKKSA